MSVNKRIVIIAGEESGDAHAAKLVKNLKLYDNQLDISGIGGLHMEQAGVTLVSDLARYGVTGITEVIRHAYVIKKAYEAIKLHLKKTNPDLLILVDYPGFNLRLAQYVKKNFKIKIVYYISPQIWAWKASRIKTMKQCIDHMAVILPFEKKIYQEAAIPVSFVGHPLLDTLPAKTDSNYSREQLTVPLNKRIVALLPGSRKNEINRHLPVMLKAATLLQAQMPSLHFIIPIASSLDSNKIKAYFKHSNLNISYTLGHARDVMIASDCVIVASGTASLEAALLEKPMCIIYKSSWLTYFMALKLLKIKYLGLCNLLGNQMIVPELLQDDCNPSELAHTVLQLLNDNDTISRMHKRLKQLKHSLSSAASDYSISHLVKILLEQNTPIN